MQLDAAMRGRYAKEAPELLNAVAEDGAGGFIMKRDPETDYCVRFENGLCGIHQQYGTDFLGDACHFYPRATRRLGEAVVMTAVPSCPEVARLALFGNAPLKLVHAEADRLPYSLKDYLPEKLSAGQALSVHEAFVSAAGDEQAPPELAFARIANTAHALGAIKMEDWPEAVPFYLQTADMRLPQPEPRPEDPFNLLHALCGLVAASKKRLSPRLAETITAMERALHTEINWQAVGLVTHDDSLACYLALREAWNRSYARQYDAVLRRWLQLQLSVALFPFAGLGSTLSERTTIIGVRLATFRLAIMCHSSILRATLPQDVVVRVAQSLARVLDHLADSAFSIQVYTEVGWVGESRMRGLLAAR